MTSLDFVLLLTVQRAGDGSVTLSKFYFNSQVRAA